MFTAVKCVTFNKMVKNTRSKKYLTLYEKSKIIEEHRNGMGVSVLAIKYGVAKSTICSIKKKEETILRVVSQSLKPNKIRKCTLRNAENPKMERKLYKWFIKQRERNLPVSGDMLKHKALELHAKLCNGRFNASDGWLQRFKGRYGVRFLKIAGEKLSSQPELVNPFITELSRIIKELNLSEHQIFNADETGLYWKLLPDKTYVSLSEKTAPGLKIAKQRLTFLGCVNASGSYKLTPLIIGKAKSPRSFKNFNNPVLYRNSKNAWMTQDIFKNWFFKHFVPEVKSFLKNENLPQKALLLLDNAPSHPPADELKTHDGSIFVMFMPPNVTPLIQPMDQNILRLTKLCYRKSLLSSVISKGKGIADALKTLTLRDATLHLYMAWQQLKPSVIAKCWNNILGQNTVEDEDDLPLARLQQIWTSEMSQIAIKDTIDLLQSIDPAEYSPKDVEEWNNDIIQHDTDLANDDDSDVSEDCEVIEVQERITHSEVLEALKLVTQWARQNTIDVSDIVNLKKIEEKAVRAHISNKKVQTKITSYFN